MRNTWVTGLALAFGITGLSSEGHAQGALEIGLYPTARRLTTAVAPPTEWGGGLTLGAGFWFTRFTAIEATAFGGFVPQQNTSWQSQFNEILPTASLVVGTSHLAPLQAYVLGGMGYERFRFPPPLPASVHNLEVGTGHAGAGLRIRLGSWTAARIEVNTQVGPRVPSVGALTGISIFPGAHRRRPAAPRIISVTDTVRLRSTDTVRVTQVVRLTDTVRVVQAAAAPSVLLVLRDASFDVGQANLRPEARVALDTVAADLVSGHGRGVRIGIIGHTDNVGAADFNYRLGLARAAAVRDYLAARGVDDNRMSISSAGKTRPIADNSTPTGRQLNRRVVVTRLP